MPNLSATVADLVSVAARCATEAPQTVATVTDDSLLDHQRQLAEAARFIEIAAATVAAEVAHRSRRELGYQGLAQRRGARTPEALVQTVSGATSSHARRLLRMGALFSEAAAHEADPHVPLAEPWLSDVVRAAAAGRISGQLVDAIRSGLGKPTEGVSTDALATAARRLLAEATSVTVERLAARARELRDELDVAGVAAREEQLRAQRYLRLFPQPSGMTRIVGLLDPESAAVVVGALDVATSPRRGGPRFVDPTEVAAAEQLIADDRTTEQIALDALVELVDVAVLARGAEAPGARHAEVRVLVTQADLDRRIGVGFLDGQTSTVSIETVERRICSSGLVPILFDDDGSALNLGRKQRLHNARQRVVIAARDGGCIAPGCDRPAAWCEVHHIKEFGAGGNTDLADGVLLCRHHHMLMHNNGWRINRIGGRYWLVPPPDVDPNQTPVPLTTKNPAVRRMLATA
jgi:hypothetical protein